MEPLAPVSPPKPDQGSAFVGVWIGIAVVGAAFAIWLGPWPRGEFPPAGFLFVLVATIVLHLVVASNKKTRWLAGYWGLLLLGLFAFVITCSQQVASGWNR